MRWDSQDPDGFLAWALAVDTTTEALAEELRAVPDAEWYGCYRLLLWGLRQTGPPSGFRRLLRGASLETAADARAKRAALEAEAGRRAP